MTDHQVLELEHFLPYRLSILSNTVSQAIAHEYEKRFGLSVTEWRVMAVLGRYEGLSAVDVALRTAMDKVAVSRALNRLVAAGRVKRTLADTDKRRSLLALTVKGWKIYDQVAPAALERERQLLSPLDAEERAWLDKLITRLATDGVAALHAADAAQSSATVDIPEPG